MNPEYAGIFQQRGHPYHDAMAAFPNARDNEFDGLFAARPLQDGEAVIDLPAGGAYLARRLGTQANVTSLEITPGFSTDAVVVDPTELGAYAGYDRAVCLAALHHFDDPLGFLGRLRDTLKPDGILHVADVPANSPLCEFLDGFVGRYNATGHAGHYLPADPAHYASLGKVSRCEETSCPWRFASETDMLSFCGRLFGLVDYPEDELRDALHDLVGVREDAQGVQLDWRLLYIDIAGG